MARGAQSKTAIFNKLMEVYPDAFFEDEGKILRIPLNEDGELVEIKVTLTAAKNNFLILCRRPPQIMKILLLLKKKKTTFQNF